MPSEFTNLFRCLEKRLKFTKFAGQTKHQPYEQSHRKANKTTVFALTVIKKQFKYFYEEWNNNFFAHMHSLLYFIVSGETNGTKQICFASNRYNNANLASAMRGQFFIDVKF